MPSHSFVSTYMYSTVYMFTVVKNTPHDPFKYPTSIPSVYRWNKIQECSKKITVGSNCSHIASTDLFFAPHPTKVDNERGNADHCGDIIHHLKKAPRRQR